MHKFEFHDVEQNEPEWFKLRAGKLTSSKLGTIMANFGKAFGEPAKRYAVDLAVEQITGEPIQSAYKTWAMDKGHEFEPLARELYESRTLKNVTNGGFFCNENTGCSLDGNIGVKGGIEIKTAVTAFAHFQRIRKQDMDSAYRWQVIGNIYFPEKDWLDFVSYGVDYPEESRLFIFRLERDQFKKEFEQIDERSEEFFSLVAKNKEIILNSNYLNLGAPVENIEPAAKTESIEDLF